MSELLKIRESMRKKKPTFVRKDAHKKIRLRKKWKRPRGLQNKLRLNFKGRGKRVRTGYRVPRKVRGLSREGLNEVIVKRAEEIKSIDAKTQGIIIAKAVGNKKRVDIIKKALESNIKILNISNAEEFAKGVESEIARRKEEKAKKSKEAEKKKEPKVKKKAEEKKVELTEEEKKKMENAEKDTILTQKT